MTTAGNLIRDYIAALERRDVDAVVDLLAPDAVSEFPFAPDGVAPCYVGHDARQFIGLVVERLIERISIHDVDITEVSPTVAFVEMTSDCLTKKGLPYRNRYVVRVESRDGRIVLWREYFDPRATAAVK